MTKSYLLLWWTCAAALHAGTDDVVLYAQTQYRGSAWVLTGDAVDLGDLEWPRLGSVRVPDGYLVRLYPEPGFQGKPLNLHGMSPDVPAHGPPGFMPRSVQRVYLGEGWPHLPEDTFSGVTLFAESSFTGRRKVFEKSEPRLTRTNFGRTRVRSLLVAPGYEAVLYSRDHFRGDKLFFDAGMHRLTNDQLGGGPVGSLRVLPVLDPAQRTTRMRDLKPLSAGAYLPADPLLTVAPSVEGVPANVALTTAGIIGLGLLVDNLVGRFQGNSDYAPLGVTLFSGTQWRGQQLTLHADTPKMRRTAMGDNRVNAVRVPPGYRVVLYPDEGYGGRGIVLNQDVADLSQTALGAAEVSSVRIYLPSPETDAADATPDPG